MARLAEHGVRTIFGLPGEENLAVVEALGDSSIELVVTRHEQHAAFMAAAHGRLAGEPGVCLATLGPGALNLFTGLAHAQLGGMPLVAITGQKPRRNNDEGSFQVVDIPAAAAPLTHWATTIDDPSTIPATVDEAFNRATSLRPGAVLIELPEDVASEAVDSTHLPIPRSSALAPGEDAIRDAVAHIERAARVVVLTGSGAATTEAATAVTRFAERTGIGVLATQLGKGSIPESHDLSYRALGIHRPDYAHLAILPAEVVIAVGYQPPEHPPLAWNPNDDKLIIHVAPWPAVVERGYRPALQLVGEVAVALGALGDRLGKRDTAGVSRVRNTIVDLLDAEATLDGDAVSPLRVVREVRALMAAGDIVALDNGVYKIWFARHYPVEVPNTLLLDNALATMGAGLATGMAAARLHPDRRTLAICGDGGFLMNVQELETAARLGLDLTILVLRDDAYGFIRWHQEEQDRPREGVTLGNPDLFSLAAAFGATAHRVDRPRELPSVLSTALGERGVSVIDCPIDYAMNELLSTDLYAKAQEALPEP